MGVFCSTTEQRGDIEAGPRNRLLQGAVVLRTRCQLDADYALAVGLPLKSPLAVFFLGLDSMTVFPSDQHSRRPLQSADNNALALLSPRRKTPIIQNHPKP